METELLDGSDTSEISIDSEFQKNPDTHLYTCTKCMYHTFLKNSLNKHLKTEKHKLMVKPLECDLCCEKFNTTSSYNKHYKVCFENTIEVKKSEIVTDELETYHNGDADCEDNSDNETTVGDQNIASDLSSEFKNPNIYDLKEIRNILEELNAYMTKVDDINIKYFLFGYLSNMVLFFMYYCVVSYFGI